MSTQTFKELNLIEPLQKALATTGYTTPTPIQAAAIPPLLMGRDLLGCAQTGTGKTAAFALPILQQLATKNRRPERRRARALILTPTRELAIQIYDNFKIYGANLKLTYSVIYGGVGQGTQVKSVSNGVDVIVATPGRLLDLINQKYLSLDQLEVFVLDEADRMLDMGFIHDIRRIIAMLPRQRHNLFFSATMPPDIERLANTILTNPVRVQVTPVSSTVELIEQSIMFVDKDKKKDLLRHVLQDKAFKRVIVFTRTKHGANKVSEVLDKNGISSAAIHGNKSQGARQKALEGFRRGNIRVLIATDIAARGIDIDDISHVINFEIPNISESYVHRIGRTARAGAQGIAISFCDNEERAYLRDIEKLIGKKIPVNQEHPYHSQRAATTALQHNHNSQHNGPQKKKSKPRDNFQRPQQKRPDSRGGYSNHKNRPDRDNRDRQAQGNGAPRDNQERPAQSGNGAPRDNQQRPGGGDGGNRKRRKGGFPFRRGGSSPGSRSQGPR